MKMKSRLSPEIISTPVCLKKYLSYRIRRPVSPGNAAAASIHIFRVTRAETSSCSMTMIFGISGSTASCRTGSAPAGNWTEGLRISMCGAPGSCSGFPDGQRQSHRSGRRAASQALRKKSLNIDSALAELCPDAPFNCASMALAGGFRLSAGRKHDSSILFHCAPLTNRPAHPEGASHEDPRGEVLIRGSPPRSR